MEDGRIYQCTMCDLRFYYTDELEKHTFEHYKKDKDKREQAEDAAMEQKQTQEQENGKEREAAGRSVKSSNDALSPSVFLQPAFVHENIQLWN